MTESGDAVQQMLEHLRNDPGEWFKVFEFACPEGAMQLVSVLGDGGCDVNVTLDKRTGKLELWCAWFSDGD